LDYYREHKPRSITKRHTGETDSDVREALIKVGQFKTASLARIG